MTEDVINVVRKLSDARVVTFSIEMDRLVITEACDQWFDCELTADETDHLIQYLQYVKSRLIS